MLRCNNKDAAKIAKLLDDSLNASLVIGHYMNNIWELVLHDEHEGYIWIADFRHIEETKMHCELNWPNTHYYVEVYETNKVYQS